MSVADIQAIVNTMRVRLGNLSADLLHIEQALTGTPANPPPDPTPVPVAPYLATPEGRQFLTLLAADRWRWPFNPTQELPENIPAFPLQSWNKAVGGADPALTNWFQAHQIALRNDVFNRGTEWANWNNWGSQHYVIV